MYHMLPRGMVGQKCHPPLSTTPEVWRCAAGRQAGRRLALQGEADEKLGGIQLMDVFYASGRGHSCTHTRVRVVQMHCKKCGTLVDAHARTSKHIPHTSHCEGLLTGQESKKNICSVLGLLALCIFL